MCLRVRLTIFFMYVFTHTMCDGYDFQSTYSSVCVCSCVVQAFTGTINRHDDPSALPNFFLLVHTYRYVKSQLTYQSNRVYPCFSLALCVCVMSLFRVCFMVIDDWNQWNEIRIRKSSHALCGILVRTWHTHTWPFECTSGLVSSWIQRKISFIRCSSTVEVGCDGYRQKQKW